MRFTDPDGMSEADKQMENFIQHSPTKKEMDEARRRSGMPEPLTDWVVGKDGQPRDDPKVHSAAGVKNGDTYIGKTGKYIATNGAEVNLFADGSWDWASMNRADQSTNYHGLGVNPEALNQLADIIQGLAYFMIPGGAEEAAIMDGGISESEAEIPATVENAEDVQYTRSNLELGRQMHNDYHAGEIGKEFRLPSGRRIDFLDLENNTIYELKPFNPRAMQQGERQLERYMQELQTMPRFRGINWGTVLDTY